MLQAFTITLALAALFSFFNYRFLKLPKTIGLMLQALVFGLLVIGSESVLPEVYNFFCQLVLAADFKTILLDVMLSFLIFAGAMHVRIEDLREERMTVFLFSTFGVLLSTFLVGSLFYFLAQILNFQIPFIHALLFGALISPTDPIAVLSLLKSAGVSKSLELKIEGESLFNDGVGVVVFMSIWHLATAEMGSFGFYEIAELFISEAIGGLLYGLALGWIGYQLMRQVEDDPKICVLISLVVVMGGYSLASIIHVSGPLAMVVAGLFIGNRITGMDYSKTTEETIDTFWEILDDLLNAVLFVLIGLVIHTIKWDWPTVGLAALTIFVVLFGRLISVGLPYSMLKHTETKPRNTIAILTWGGLRGGISVALALSLSPDVSGDTLLVVTYLVVLFSIIVQGLTLPRFVKYLKSNPSE